MVDRSTRSDSLFAGDAQMDDKKRVCACVRDSTALVYRAWPYALSLLFVDSRVYRRRSTLPAA